ncbi:MAG: hypothetical protein ABSG15_08870 [FCB group bacterium]|jgi:PHD/YefM family antitoxin component YafN of YafNO toxin-antitoxin module
MITYIKEEILPSTLVSRNFGGILDKLRMRKIEKIAVMRNNRMEAVLLPVEDYENLKEIAELAEHSEIYNIIKQREKTSLKKAVSFENVLKEYKIKPDEL